MLVKTVTLENHYTVTMPAAPWESGAPAKKHKPKPPRRRSGGKAQALVFDGVPYASLTKAAKALGVDRKTLDSALRSEAAMQRMRTMLAQRQMAVDAQPAA
jgi:hypothetical protein